MKLVIILLILWLPILSFGQFTSSVDLVGSLDYGYRSVTEGEINNSPSGLIIESRKRETGKFGYRFGFNYNQRIGKKLFLKSGIRLANLGYSSGKITGLRWGSEIQAGLAAGSLEPIFDPTLPHEIEFFYEYWFLEIPVIGRYEFNEKRFSPFIEIGISPNIHLESRTKQKTDLGDSRYSDVNESDAFNKMHLVGSISFGINFSATESFQLFAQPIFRYHLTKTVDAPIKEHLYNAGIEIGARKRLK